MRSKRAPAPDPEDARKLDEIASVAMAEKLGGTMFYTHVGLILLAAALAAGIRGLWTLSAIAFLYLLTLTAEKALALWAFRHEKPSMHAPVLGILTVRALIYNVLVLSVWAMPGDTYKMAAAALMVAATVNIFVFHATHPRIILCTVIPTWLNFGAMAANVILYRGTVEEGIAALLVFLFIAPYFLLGLRQANRQATELAVTRNALTQSQKHDALGKLSTGIAHDFNNILAVTLGNAELLHGAPAHLRTHLADEIIKAAERGAALSQQLLAFGSRSQLAPAVHDVHVICKDVRAMLDRLLPRSIETDVVIAPQTPKLFVDRALLETAMLNLAINARDAMPDGGTLTITVGPTEQDGWQPALLTEAAPGVTIRVADTGVGIPVSEQQQVFDPFYTTKPVGSGSGLGLSMVLGFARQSGGTLTLESTPGQGTTLILTLPAAPDDAKHSATNAALPQVAATRGTVLLVEDEAGLRHAYMRHLEIAGFNVVLAPDGEAGSQLLDEGLRPAGLVTDLAMPGAVQGDELIRRARRLMPDIPVVLVSGYPDRVVTELGAMNPAVDILQKPLRGKTLVDAVIQALTPADRTPSPQL
ncbi:response regulator [Sulfitobacter albidus]|uniref:histidine kinase n=1 Tax=Sulfitobacter albidus TaxID=2829501 RepID=A0A975PMD6_9RHOB|nr:ATP-binding protein [Sulfitobacter albidus]QUJ76130.1 response regulator [Sulfitobacter albidus]